MATHRYILTIEGHDDRDPLGWRTCEYRLRLLLKRALRDFGFRCVTVASAGGLARPSEGTDPNGGDASDAAGGQ